MNVRAAPFMRRDSQWAISCRKLDEKLGNYCTEKRQEKLD